MSGKWLSQAAVHWALFEADGVPARLVSALVAVAMHADEHGRGAWPSASTVAAITRKSEAQAKKDMHELEKLGLLRTGDRRLVMHMRADRRPNVWDLAMPERGASRRTPSSGGGGDRGSSERTPRTVPRGSSGTETGFIWDQNGVRPDEREEFLKNSGTGAPPARVAGAGDGTPETQTPAPPGDREPVDVGAEIARAKARLAALNGRPADVPLTGVPVGGTPVPPAETPDGHAVDPEHRQRELDRLAAWMAEHPEAAAQ